MSFNPTRIKEKMTRVVRRSRGKGREAKVVPYEKQGVEDLRSVPYREATFKDIAMRMSMSRYHDHLGAFRGVVTEDLLAKLRMWLAGCGVREEGIWKKVFERQEMSITRGLEGFLVKLVRVEGWVLRDGCFEEVREMDRKVGVKPIL